VDVDALLLLVIVTMPVLVVMVTPVLSCVPGTLTAHPSVRAS
jgi:hypothetical protein